MKKNKSDFTRYGGNIVQRCLFGYENTFVGLILLLLGALSCHCMADSAASPVFGIDSKNIRISYLVEKDGTLELQKAVCLDGKWTSPLGGPLFPYGPCHPTNHRGNGVRFKSAMEVIQSNGDFRIEPIYVGHQVQEESSDIQHLTIRLKDRVYPIDVELHVRAYVEHDIFEQWLVVKNRTDKPIAVPRLDSMYWQANAKDGVYLEWYESWQAHEAGTVMREKLTKGNKVLECRDGNRHKEGPMPHMVVGFGDYPDEETVPCLLMALVWSGSNRFSFEINSESYMETSIGSNPPGHPKVAPGQSLASPAMVYTLSSAGKGQASRKLHRWARSYLIRNGDRLRLVDNNSWEGCQMKIAEPDIAQMIADSAGLGIELYVLDDGWFGNKFPRNRDNAGLGDWQVNTNKIPHGISCFVDLARKEGIQFGIWVEPEMVNAQSELAQMHLEWLMTSPGREPVLQRTQLTLDVANPAVQQFMFEVVDTLLTENPGIRFVKWDANANINNAYSPYLGSERQGEMLNEYMAGYYGVIKQLAETHTHVDFQACAAGGGRSDYGAMRYSHMHWPSDNTRPSFRLGAQWNFSVFFPAICTTAHVTHRGDFGTKYRFDVSMMAQLGMEVDTRKCTSAYIEASKHGIAAYKKVRDIVQFGDLYRHQNPFDSTTPSLNFVSSDKSRALGLAYQIGEIEEPLRFASPISGLDPMHEYEIKEINLPPDDASPRLAFGVSGQKSGARWMDEGVALIFTRKYDSAAFTLELAE
ncbi:alpha-galactosidase [Pontiella sulfatireligans]|uniref:alpha-galactosidase n=1 Tax=Pontiella sulfatireligans TaxID=2750658 RepID=A0A6C2UH69_9BACT|nr:alpha-galactosidase [Pontiella sulfatireligans]VGO18857.1 Alpha-galactosidase [Pontiella sulfatireligans]